MELKVVAFDCFGTVFDMTPISRDEIAAYVEHVRRDDFSPFAFPESWRSLNAHPDAREGIERLQDAGLVCVTLSNGSSELLTILSQNAGIVWNRIVDLSSHRVYKPHVEAYRVVGRETGFGPHESLMVTANPTFGDIEGAAAIGMRSQVIRHGHPNTIVELAEMLIGRRRL